MLLLSFAIIILLLGTYILFQASNRRTGIVFFFLALNLAFWVTTSVLTDLSTNEHIALFWARTAIIGPFIFGPFLLLFSYTFPILEKISLKKTILIFTPFFLVLPFIPTKFNVDSVTLKDGWTDFDPGVLYIILLIYFVIYISFSVWRFIIIKPNEKGLVQNQINYILFGIVSVVVIGIITNLVLPLFGYGRASAYGPAGSILFITAIFYSVLRHRLFDIRIFLRRAFVILGALISSLSLALLLIYFNASILNEAIPSTVVFVFSLLVGILLFSWFQKGFLKIANKYFFTTLYNPQKVTEQLAAAMNKTLELNSLLGLITKQLTSVFGIEQYGFAICDQQKKINCYVELSNGLDNSSIHLILQQEAAIRYLEKSSSIIVTDEISRFIDEETLRPTNTTEQDRNALLQFKGALQQAGIAVCVPMVSGKKLNSLLLLGSKLTKDAFTTEDIHLLETVADQAAVAIDNARLYKEAQEFNLKLKAEVEKATKDLREANEKLKELDEAKSEFMSIASHQLRTPLAGIIGYLSMMIEGDYGKFQKNQMETITEVFHASQRLVHLVNTFLNVTRIEAGRFTLSFVPTNLVEIVDQQVKELLPTSNKKGVKLSFAQPKEAVIEAEVDDKIRDVFLNLVDNAIKYTPEGSVTAAIKKDGRDKVHFTCTDTGVGIAKDEVSHLFEKFVRGNSIAKVQPDGSGLGLYIVKRIVEGHNGKLWAESEGVGKGTTFHVVIPVKQKQKQFKAQAEAVFEGKSKPGEGGSSLTKNRAKNVRKSPSKK